ncbi:MAG: hypothetical protein ACLPH3_25170 [Terracidiphilus sp.]
MSNLLLVFTVVFVLSIAVACAVGSLVMLGGIYKAEEPSWRKRKAGVRAAGTHHVFKDLH